MSDSAAKKHKKEEKKRKEDEKRKEREKQKLEYLSSKSSLKKVVGKSSSSEKSAEKSGSVNETSSPPSFTVTADESDDCAGAGIEVPEAPTPSSDIENAQPLKGRHRKKSLGAALVPHEEVQPAEEPSATSTRPKLSPASPSPALNKNIQAVISSEPLFPNRKMLILTVVGLAVLSFLFEFVWRWL